MSYRGWRRSSQRGVSSKMKLEEGPSTVAVGGAAEKKVGEARRWLGLIRRWSGKLRGVVRELCAWGIEQRATGLREFDLEAQQWRSGAFTGFSRFKWERWNGGEAGSA